MSFQLSRIKKALIILRLLIQEMIMKPRIALFSCLMSLLSVPAHAALDPAQPLAEAPPYSLFEAWAKPVQPFAIWPGVWYVGTENLSSVLITTPQGHILIDAGLDASAPRIRRNIEALGFRMADIRYIANSHARLDQAGGIARLKAWSGARVIASHANAEQMARGGKEDFALGDALPFPPVTVDMEAQDGQPWHLGGVTLAAIFTPGHLPGATSWKVTLADGKTLIYADSLATPGYPLINNRNYPTLVEDIRRSFARLEAQQVDIFLANKGERFGLMDKMARKARGENNAFIDRQGLAQYVAQSRAAFEKQLAAQRAQP
ncbi:TPA: HARLDQ motif MBL-fold protein [Cronobacter sakazakii]|nr:HARLDQ motif MBL-fold protein [Cronobacter sakazakii]EGT5651503.1 HARLDQ motif MBL-fold protein [Cronobacter sakazakii]EGT5748390.1 HARLDQ motif MBL-fold protein [Cronobacter sakazakii]EGT5751536.1 HARLDQ motif MBL-fold protein [Cronobacter sakazakii]EIZ2180924.1 HARLDQ motif MBL-fold protein [Cronobacter sakazakii]